MKKIILFLTVLCIAATGDGKNQKTTEDEDARSKLEPTIQFTPPTITADSDLAVADYYDETQCFRFNSDKILKDSVIYVTEYILELEYGWSNNITRIVAETKRFNVADIINDSADNEIIAGIYRSEMEFIDGTFTIEGNKFVFTPDDADNYETRTFTIRYKPQSKEIETLLSDPGNNVWTRGECYIAEMEIMIQ